MRNVFNYVSQEDYKRGMTILDQLSLIKIMGDDLYKKHRLSTLDNEFHIISSMFILQDIYDNKKKEDLGELLLLLKEVDIFYLHLRDKDSKK